MPDPENVYFIATEGTIVKVARYNTPEDIAAGAEELKRFLLNGVPSAILREALPQLVDEIIRAYYEYYCYVKM
jgi:hypothetical protein